MKLWSREDNTDKLFEDFTIGNDRILDLELAYFDVLGSIGHVKMLGKIGLISPSEATLLSDELEKIKVQTEQGEFIIEEGIEDCHSQIELQLIRALGDVGKKVHAGRSRNDQVLTALKLYSKAQLQQIVDKVAELFDLWMDKSDEYKDQLMPGYTHMQVAMPSSFGLWFGAHAESLIDDLELIYAAYRIADKSPLGSAAGYGNSFPLDRAYAATEMGFSALNTNVVYAQMTRGKLEKSVAFAISSLAATLSKYATDICLYNGQDYGFFELDTKYTTGSSIMPHKQNPDGFELIRGKCNQLQALPYELTLIQNNLPTGYHRDLQQLKDHYMPSIDLLQQCLHICIEMTKGLAVSQGLIDDAKYDLLFTVEEVNKLVQSGLPFREAYLRVSEKVKSGNYAAERNINHTHIGSIGNLGNEQIKECFNELRQQFT